MFARLTSELLILALAGMAWLGSHVGCGNGQLATGVGDSLGGLYDSVAGYVCGSDSYSDSFWGDSYEPYLGEYYNAEDGQAIVR